MSRAPRLLERALPLGLAGLFLLVLATQLREALTATYLNGDAASAPVIAELFGERGDGRVVLGEYFWLEPLLLLRAIEWLPGHRQLGQLLPLGIYALAVAGVAWSVARAVGARRGLLVAAILACPAPAIFDALATLNFHGPALAHTVLLGVTLVALVGRGAAWSGRRLALGAVLLALVTAPGLATDQLLLIGGVVPFLVAATALAWARQLPARAAWAAWGAMAGAGAGAGAVLALAAASGLQENEKPFRTSTWAEVVSRTELLLDCFAVFFHGATGQVLDGRTGLQYVVALAAAALLVTAVVIVRRAVPRLRELRPEVAALTAFWGASGLLLALAFVSTSAVVDVSSVRYVLALWPAVLVVLAVGLPRRLAERGLAALAAAVAALALASLARGEYTDNPSGFTEGAVAGELARFVEREGLDHGYSGYWSAASLTYQTRFAARVYPVAPCAAVACPYALHRLDAWYVPARGVRTFYVVDNAAPEPRAPAPPQEWGAVRTTGFGSLSVWVYDYDVASRLGPAPN